MGLLRGVCSGGSAQVGPLRWVCSGGRWACPNLCCSADSVTVGKEECSQHEGLPAQET